MGNANVISRSKEYTYGSSELLATMTGHLGSLMSMADRMYDPQLGRFLSPDNFVQAPDDPQNYNRYSYCLNNPLKYTDPDGEFVVALVGAILFTTGMTNVIIQALGNYINADISGSYSGRITDYPVLMHEYGHTFDSREFGPAYLFAIGIPSIISAYNYKETEVNGISTTTHRLFWTEQRASMNALLYFQKHYDVDKNLFRTYLPYLFNNQ